MLPAALTLALVIGGTAWTLAVPEPIQERVTAHVDSSDGATRWEVTGTTDWGRALDGTTATSEIEMPQVESAATADGGVDITVEAPRDASALVLSAEGGLLTEVTVDGVAVPSAQGVQEVSVHGVRAGQRVRLTATAAPEARLTLVERSYDPSLAAGWTAPGEEVSLVQPRMEVSVPLPR